MRWWNSPGFRDDDGSIQWWSVRGALKSRCWVAWFRAHNRFMDACAVLAGACNADPWDPERRECAGGYSHWRCGKRRGHIRNTLVTGHEDGSSGPHRFINYTWGGPGHRTQYDPLPVRNADNTDWFDTRTVIPFRKLADGRHAVASRRRSRELAVRYARKYEELRRKPRKISNPFAEDDDAVRPD